MDVGDKVKLEPCPFCGTALNGEIDDECSYHTHPKNDCWFSQWEFDRINVAQWNRRTPSASIGEGGLPELPWGDDFEAWLEVRTEHEVSAAVRQYAREVVAADRQSSSRQMTVKQEAGMDMAKIDAKSAETRMDAGFERAHGRDVKTWQERMYTPNEDGMLPENEEEAMQAEIADLRAQLARQSQGDPVARVTRGTEFGPGLAFIANGKDSPAVGTLLYAAPPLSSEPQSEKVDTNVG